MNELALFAGAGGGILGGHLLGWRTVCAVEYNSYAASVLLARQNDGILPPFPIWDDVRTFDGRPWRGIVDVVSGGFPCQDISVAGKGAGITGERSGMWAHMARIIGEVRPRFAFIENSPMLTVRGLDRVLCDLASMGYDAEWGVISAADCGAPHKRDRIWIVAHSMPSKQRWQQWKNEAKTNVSDSNSHGKPACTINAKTSFMRNVDHADLSQCEGGRLPGRVYPEHSNTGGSSSDEVVADSESVHAQGQHSGPGEKQSWGGCWWPAEPDVGRVANGVAARVDRLTAIGNGQVPVCAATAFKLLYGRQ